MRMTIDEARQLIKRMAHAIENVLEGAEIDDGIVSVSALVRLDELYEQDIRPMGPSRMPDIDAEPREAHTEEDDKQ